MKRMIFGLGLLISGVIGFVGFSIATACGFDLYIEMSLNWLVILIFAVMAVAGLVISVKELKRE